MPGADRQGIHVVWTWFYQGRTGWACMWSGLGFARGGPSIDKRWLQPLATTVADRRPRTKQAIADQSVGRRLQVWLSVVYLRVVLAACAVLVRTSLGYRRRSQIRA